MSWIVKSLLRDSIRIKQESDIDSEEYNDLLVIENKISQLYDSGIITDEEKLVIDYISDGNYIVDSRDVLGKERHYISRDINNICRKISFFLGGYFTDEGYIHYMRNKYNLSDQQVNEMINYMNDKYNYKIMRKK